MLQSFSILKPEQNYQLSRNVFVISCTLNRKQILEHDYSISLSVIQIPYWFLNFIYVTDIWIVFFKSSRCFMVLMRQKFCDLDEHICFRIE